MEGAEGDRRGTLLCLLCFFEKSFRMQPHALGRNVKYNVLYLDVSLARRAAPDPKQR